MARPAGAAQRRISRPLVASIQQGGYVIVFRHGATNRDQADRPAQPGQRRQAAAAERSAGRWRDVGPRSRRCRFRSARVYTSRFFRAVETGQAGERQGLAPLADISEGGPVVTPIENDRRADALRKLAATPPERGSNTLIVSHKPNIIDAFGKDWFDVKEGEASVFKPDGNGKYVLAGKLQAAQWLELAKAR
jgi:hypothetical protein